MPSKAEAETRRRALEKLSLLPMVIGATVAAPVVVARPSSALQQQQQQLLPVIDKSQGVQNNNANDIDDSGKMLSSLVFEKILGGGSFKTVYLVSSGGGDATDEPSRRYYALAVERLRFKNDVKEGLRGVTIPQSLQQTFTNQDDRELLEQVDMWWFQSTRLPDFEPGARVFPMSILQEGRSQKPPTGSFRGSKWLMALKPVYDMDLKTFAQMSPTLYPIIETGQPKDNKQDTAVKIVAGVALTGKAAVKLAMEACRAGKLVHAAGLVHRDIKPKNLMLNHGRPVLIDFGFAQVGERLQEDDEDDRICITQPGRVRGELRYVLAQDVAQFRGCQRGDRYAMGKMLYEVIFGVAPGDVSSGKQTITEDAALAENARFRTQLEEGNTVTASRFRMSTSERDALLGVIRGLCRQDHPISFAKAEELLGAELVASN